MKQEFLSGQALPIDVQQLAEAHHLGGLMASYPKKKPGIGGWIARFLVVLLFMVAPLVVESPMLFSYLARIPVPLLLAVLGFDLVWYGIIFAVLFPWYRNRRQQGYVFTQGFLCYGGAKTVLVRWEEIETVWRGTTSDEGVSLESPTTAAGCPLASSHGEECGVPCLGLGWSGLLHHPVPLDISCE